MKRIAAYILALVIIAAALADSLLHGEARMVCEGNGGRYVRGDCK